MDLYAPGGEPGEADPTFGFEGSKYTPLAPPLTAEQVSAMSNACGVAQQTGRRTSIGAPFEYTGPAFPGLLPGDIVTAMVPHGGECITDAEARRLCAEGVTIEASCPKGSQWMKFAAIGVAAAALIWVWNK